MRGHGRKRLIELRADRTQRAVELARVESLRAAIMPFGDHSESHEQVDPELAIDHLAIEFGQATPTAELVDPQGANGAG